MRLNRFHLPGARAHTPQQLPEDEAVHAVRVLRVRTGQAVRVFDGRGREYDATIGTVVRAGVEILVGGEVSPPSPERRIAVTLVMAALKGDAMDAVVRDAAMLGVGSVLPLVSARAETTLEGLARGHRRERWQRIAVASVKQCGRAVVPDIGEPLDVIGLLKRWSAEPSAVRLLCVEPEAGGSVMRVRDVAAPTGPVSVVVGPEGGWSGDEVERLAMHAGLLRLEGTTLRAESAPIVLLSSLLTVWGEF